MDFLDSHNVYVTGHRSGTVRVWCTDYSSGKRDLCQVFNASVSAAQKLALRSLDLPAIDMFRCTQPPFLRSL
jgi:hypothetical protein